MTPGGGATTTRPESAPAKKRDRTAQLDAFQTEAPCMDAINDYPRAFMMVREPLEHGGPRPPVFELDRVPTPLGELLLVTDAAARLRAAEFADYASRMHRLLRRQYGTQLTLRPGAAPPALRERIAAYFEGTFDALEAIETQTAGTDFQRAVWAELRRIPAGQTRSYRELAVAVGRPTAIRAVGHANGCSPIAVVVPCHRILGAKSNLTGYGSGIERKRWLLLHEGVQLPPPDQSVGKA